MTPYQLTLHAKVYGEKREEENKEKITLAYINAMWTYQWFGKKKPESLEKIINNKPKEAMTDEAMLERVKVLNAIFGGEVK